MNTSELLDSLNQQGVQLFADKDKLSIRSPKGVLTPELRAELMARKGEILMLLHETDVADSSTFTPLSKGLSLQTIGRLISGLHEESDTKFKPPVIDPHAMAQKLTVTFKPLPNHYKNQEILKFRAELETKLQSYGVKIATWQQATTQFTYEISIPGVRYKKKIKTRIVKASVDAVIDVERNYSPFRKLAIVAAEQVYKIYSRTVVKGKEISVARIAKLSSWAEEHAARYIEDPTNTQVITLAQLNPNLINYSLPYQNKIKIGLNTLIKTFSEIVIGVSKEKISILNMNLSDSLHPREQLDNFVLNSLIPKVFVPILPLPISRFALGEYKPDQSIYAKKLVDLGHQLAATGLLPPGSKLSEVIKRKSHRDIVNVIVNGRTGVSYGFVAYAEPPHYVGALELSEQEWEELFPVEGFSAEEVRRNAIGRRYIKTKVRAKYLFRQLPDIWLVSSRSGSNKTKLQLESDIIRIGLTSQLMLQLPEGVDPKTTDIKPSYDIYVMLAIALAAALYAPELVSDGAPIVHFHGYPAFEWLQPNEYCVGVNNPSVPCGTYESGVFNFLGISSLADRQVEDIALVSLLEPDHGTNVIARDLEYLVARLRSGCAAGQIELGGKHFASLKMKLENRGCL